jgi:hypothetical protein
VVGAGEARTRGTSVALGERVDRRRRASRLAAAPAATPRVTEAAALAAGRWAGRGDKEGCDGAAVDALREVIAGVPMGGRCGHRGGDEAPMLFNGEQVGDGAGPEVDIAVDPVDGTTLLVGERARHHHLAERTISPSTTPGPCRSTVLMALPSLRTVDPGRERLLRLSRED